MAGPSKKHKGNLFSRFWKLASILLGLVTMHPVAKFQNPYKILKFAKIVIGI